MLKSDTKKKILLLLASGTVLSLTRSPKQYYLVLRQTTKAWQEINRHALYRALSDFHHQKLIDYREHKDGTITITLTKSGEKIAHSFDLDKIKIPKPLRWDKKWRLVIYDIPNKNNKGRDALREKLKELGFYEWQKSAFIYPYPCQKEVEFVIEFFELRPYVNYAELLKPTNEAKLKLHFKLF
ncbi:MAG: hypothetical protein HYV76_01410 [Candidatus Vogelbacteria bacterium]|nr:hypothetical protein [Candidatus Vogelbacteria bacterium]